MASLVSSLRWSAIGGALVAAIVGVAAVNITR